MTTTVLTGCLTTCTCGGTSTLGANVDGAHFAFGDHPIDIANQPKTPLRELRDQEDQS